MHTATCSHSRPPESMKFSDVQSAIRHESRMEAECDVLISRQQDELREARRTGSPSSVVEMLTTSIEKISVRRDGHRANILAYKHGEEIFPGQDIEPVG